MILNTIILLEFEQDQQKKCVANPEEEKREESKDWVKGRMEGNVKGEWEKN
jgi:hypothetical protein